MGRPTEDRFELSPPESTVVGSGTRFKCWPKMESKILSTSDEIVEACSLLPGPQAFLSPVALTLLVS
jgi:hypothetical protein